MPGAAILPADSHFGALPGFAVVGGCNFPIGGTDRLDARSGVSAQGDSPTSIPRVPPPLFPTGVTSAFPVIATLFPIPKIGARQLSILSLGGQLMIAVIVGHSGTLQAPKDPITPKKIVGTCLLLCGAVVALTSTRPPLPNRSRRC